MGLQSFNATMFQLAWGLACARQFSTCDPHGGIWGAWANTHVARKPETPEEATKERLSHAFTVALTQPFMSAFHEEVASLEW